MTFLNIKNMKFPAFYLILGGSLGIVCGGAKGEGGGAECTSLVSRTKTMTANLGNTVTGKDVTRE